MVVTCDKLSASAYHVRYGRYDLFDGLYRVMQKYRVVFHVAESSPGLGGIFVSKRTIGSAGSMTVSSASWNYKGSFCAFAKLWPCVRGCCALRRILTPE